MPALEIFDTVVVKNNRTLLGTVERTHSSEDYEPLEDYLILQHVPVPQPILTEFVTTGVPPRGYVFVSILDEERGSFLASEEDLTLLCRSFDLGDIVKRDDGETGTVVDVSDTYNVQPMWLTDKEVMLASALPLDHLEDCVHDNLEQCPHGVLFNVPGSELTHKQTLFEDHLICYKEWLGVVQEVEVDVVVQCEDRSIVILDSPDDLYMPIPEPKVPLVSLPEFDENEIRRPDLPSAFQGHPWVIPTTYPRPCTFVVTSRNTLRSGRWVLGKYSPACLNGGIVIDLVPRHLVAQWLTCNPFAPLKASQVVPPAPVQTLYSNHSSYGSSADLKPNPNLTVIDLLSPPTGETRRSTKSPSESEVEDSACKANPVSLFQDLKVGDCVRFRDPSAAAVKYQGQEDKSSGRFSRVSEDLTNGWDLNIFKVIARQQKVQVLWQGGTKVYHDANEIQRFGGFEPDFAPTDLVLNRAELKQAPDFGGHESAQWRDFNEMTFIESPHSLHPAKVGVIQSVDTRERIAQVRWFQHPNVVLLENGNRLSADSRLGPIGNIIEEVSLFEVMTFPAFGRRLRDVALLAPKKLSRRAAEIIRSKTQAAADAEITAITHTLDPQRIFHAVRDIVRQRGLFESQDSIKASKDEASGVDWLGELISTGLDGSVTVRLSGAKPCRDITISPDEILALIHLDYLEADEAYSDHSMDDEDDLLDEGGLSDYEESASTISETVEYEGGERLDNDSGDENWESAEEGGEVTMGNAVPSSRLSVHDVEMADNPISTRTALQPSSLEPGDATSFTTLHSHMPSAIPPAFEILSVDPPPDQYQPSNSEGAPSPVPMKRLRLEHKALSTSLPAGQIYVRTYESRLDLMRCLIIGPPDTPYEYAPFLVDLYLPPQYPVVPPLAHFHSWTSGLGRINPNLYEEGKICLSLLGTWAAKLSNEGWCTKASILQLLVSLQGLVMVSKPFYNEAGFEDEEAGGGYVNESAQYSERAFVMARRFVRFALTRPPVGVEDILAWLYLPSLDDEGGLKDMNDECLLVKVIARAQTLIKSSEALRSTEGGHSNADIKIMDGLGSTEDKTKAFLRPLSKGAVVMLRRQLQELLSCLSAWCAVRRGPETEVGDTKSKQGAGPARERSKRTPEAQQSSTKSQRDVMSREGKQRRAKQISNETLVMAVDSGVRMIRDQGVSYRKTPGGSWFDGRTFVSVEDMEGRMSHWGVVVLGSNGQVTAENPLSKAVQDIGGEQVVWKDGFRYWRRPGEVDWSGDWSHGCTKERMEAYLKEVDLKKESD